MEMAQHGVRAAARPEQTTKPRPAPAGSAAAALAAAALAACGGGGDGGGGDGGTGPTPIGGDTAGNPGGAGGTQRLTEAQASRLLAQATPGASRSAIRELQDLGPEAWLEDQFDRPVDQTHYDWLDANGYNIAAYQNNAAGLDATLWRKLIAADDALRQRVALALSEILVVSVLGVRTVFRQFCVAHYMDILEANAFGNYRKLLEEVTLSTAMGHYLTYRKNRKANAMGLQPDENYARELMQLFTIGVVQLNPDGTPKAGGQETYGPEDVSGLARVFTGWDHDAKGMPKPYPAALHLRPMAQNWTLYETGAKSFLGVHIPAGTSAKASLDIALDTLFQHPNCPPFVCRQLIQRLVTSNPTPAYVQRVAAAFIDNGKGERGDLRAVLRAILLDPEARADPGTPGATSGKLREPMLRLLNWARACGVRSPSGKWALGDLSNPATRLGQSPLRASSVFNFFSPGYVPPGSATARAGMVGPEFQIVGETSVAGYINFMQQLVSGNYKAREFDLQPDYAPLLALADDPRALLAELDLLLAANQLAPATLASLEAALGTVPARDEAGRRNRVHAALLLVLAAPDYLVQK